MRPTTVSLREYTAGELRAHLARERISVSALARRLGWTQSYLARRVDGRVAFDLDDLEKVTAELRIQVADLLPHVTAANTLRDRHSAERPRSAAVSSTRPPARPARQSTRPARTTPAADTRRPSMLPRPASR